MADEVDLTRRYLVTPEKPSRLPQYLTAFAATLGSLAIGFTIGYSSPAGEELSSNSTITDKVHFDSDTENVWFSSSLVLGSMIGSPIGGYTIKLIGRKGTMLAVTIPFLAGWALIGFGQNFLMLIAGRVLTGLIGGILAVAVPSYIAEFSSADIRGTLGASFQLMMTIGILVVYVLGTFINWRWLALCGAICPIIMSISMFFCPESPSYLLSKAKVEEARVSLQFFRGENWDIEEEFTELIYNIEQAEMNKASLKTLFLPYIRKPLFLSLMLFVFQQLSGLTPIVFNLDLIFTDSGVGIGSWSGIIVGAIQVIATVFGCYLMDRTGRKILISISSAFMGLSLVLIGVYFYLYEHKPIVAQNLQWLPLASLVMYFIAVSIGMGPVPWVYLGEVFPANVRELAGSIGTFTNWACSFASAFMFLPLQHIIHDYGVYWFFAACCGLSLVFDIVLLKETKGKTLQEISEMFGAPRIENDTDAADGNKQYLKTKKKTDYEAI